MFLFLQVFTFSMKNIMMIHQSHMKNIIFHPNFTSNHIFLITFVDNNAIQFTSFLELFDKFLDSKTILLFFWITCSKASKTRASRLYIEEADISTVVVMNQRRDNFFFNCGFLFLKHYGCSVSNKYIPPGIILV